MTRISLVVPCYNEEANIQKGVLDKIGNFTKGDRRFSEVLIVDDGSDDMSKDIIISKYLKIFPKFRLIENEHKGKAYAVMEGIRQAAEKYVMFMDIDLATPIEESEKLIAEIKNTDYTIVIGSRKAHREGAPFARRLMALGMIFIRDFFIGLRGVRDTQCGFKLFRTDLAQDIISKLQVFRDKARVKGSSVSAAFDLEFLFLAHKMGHRIREIPVTWRHVETKNVNFVKDPLETLWDILRIKLYNLQGRYV